MLKFIVLALAVFLFYCYSSPFYKLADPVSYRVSLPEKFEGPLAPNDRLDKAERLLENHLHWPESFAVHKGHIYTGLGDGRIVRISNDKMTTVARTGKDCAGQHEEDLCGRPLGMEFTKDGLLYVADTYLGIFKIDVKTGKKNLVLPSRTVVNGKPLTFLNDVALDEKQGVLYFTQSTTKWNMSYVVVSIMEHDLSGRLLKYNLTSKEIKVLVTGLSYANGVTLSQDGTALLVSDGNNNRIFKYFIHGPKADTVSDLPMILPGEPDNISRNKRGNYWVGFVNARTKESPALYDRFSEHPFLRKVFIHLYRLFTAPVCLALNLLPYPWVREIAFELETMRIAADIPIVINYGIIVEFDDSGKILQSLHSPSGKMSRISEVLEFDGYLYLGSWRNKFIGRVKL